MLQIKSFTFNPFQENTYLLYDESLQCAIVDPGMNNGSEENTLHKAISSLNLKPVKLLNTHCHIDHVLGNKWVADTYGLLPEFTEKELPVITSVPAYAPQMGIQYSLSPLPETYLPEVGEIAFGNTSLSIIFCPGHSPGHVCFYSEKNGVLIGGDVLFRGSIGRTDLPGGNHAELLRNIREKVFSLAGTCTVYPGHGTPTTIEYERNFNPFFK